MFFHAAIEPRIDRAICISRRAVCNFSNSDPAGNHVSNLGYSGVCDLDPAVARTLL
jgi:hypothetical protein